MSQDDREFVFVRLKRQDSAADYVLAARISHSAAESRMGIEVKLLR
jgi:hypothetical protein